MAKKHIAQNCNVVHGEDHGHVSPQRSLQVLLASVWTFTCDHRFMFNALWRRRIIFVYLMVCHARAHRASSLGLAMYKMTHFTQRSATNYCTWLANEIQVARFSRMCNRCDAIRAMRPMRAQGIYCDPLNRTVDQVHPGANRVCCCRSSHETYCCGHRYCSNTCIVSDQLDMIC